MNKSDWISIFGTVVSVIGAIISIFGAKKAKSEVDRVILFKNNESKILELEKHLTYGNDISNKFRKFLGKDISTKERRDLLKIADEYYDYFLQKASFLKYNQKVTYELSQLKAAKDSITDESNTSAIKLSKDKISEINKYVAMEKDDLLKEKDNLILRQSS